MVNCWVRAHTYLLFLLLCIPLAAQTSEQQALEKRRARLQSEITEMNRMLSLERKEKSSILDQMESLDQKINVRQELIRVTNRQANLLNRQINTNVRKIAKLREDLVELKEGYAKMVRSSYKNRSDQNLWLFLMSSESFMQAYKRWEYVKQYRKHRRGQAEEIKTKTDNLTSLNKELVSQKKRKDKLITENRSERNKLSEAIGSQKELLQSVKANESNYVKNIEKKKKERKRIDREIENLIRTAIANSNKKAGKSGAKVFELTPEHKMVANNFKANKGQLIWPVERGVISQGFGVYADKVYPGIKHQNNGVTISTNKGEKARAIFDGEVITVKTDRLGRKAVFVRHGNYISTYWNLAQTYVQKGDKVTAREHLGEIYTNQKSGVTKLKFYLYQNTTKLDPEQWISKS